MVHSPSVPAVADTPPSRPTPPLGEVSATAEKVYAAIASYALDEACVWPKQTRVAADLGVHRDTVRVALAELRDAGWITWRREWTWRDESGQIVLDPNDTTGLARSRWQHNVYDLLAPFMVHEDMARRRVREAHRRADLRRLVEQSGTNPVGEEKRPPGLASGVAALRAVR